MKVTFTLGVCETSLVLRTGEIKLQTRKANQQGTVEIKAARSLPLPFLSATRFPLNCNFQLLFVFQRRGPQRSVDMIVSSSFILGMILVILMCVQVSNSFRSLPPCKENLSSSMDRVCVHIVSNKLNVSVVQMAGGIMLHSNDIMFLNFFQQMEQQRQSLFTLFRYKREVRQKGNEKSDDLRWRKAKMSHLCLKWYKKRLLSIFSPITLPKTSTRIVCYR